MCCCWAGAVMYHHSLMDFVSPQTTHNKLQGFFQVRVPGTCEHMHTLVFIILPYDLASSLTEENWEI